MHYQFNEENSQKIWTMKSFPLLIRRAVFLTNSNISEWRKKFSIQLQDERETLLNFIEGIFIFIHLY